MMPLPSKSGASSSNNKNSDRISNSSSRGVFDGSNLDAIQDMLDCPVCGEFVSPPVYICGGNHHLICGECRKKIKSCPVCDTLISEHPCHFAEQCIEHMNIPCKYQNDGCNEIIKGTEFRNHLSVCKYRPLECLMSHCGKKVPFRQYFDHLKTAHRNKVNGIENSNKQIVEWWIEGDTVTNARWPPYYFTCYNNVFLYMCVSSVHGMWEWVWILASEEEAKRFQVTVKLENIEKMAELQWKGCVHSIRKPIEEIARSGLCLITNCKDMRNPYLFKKASDAKRYFWRSVVEIQEVKPPRKNSFYYLQSTENLKNEDKTKVGGGKVSTPLAAAVAGSSLKGQTPSTATLNFDNNGFALTDEDMPSLSKRGSKISMHEDERAGSTPSSEYFFGKKKSMKSLLKNALEDENSKNKERESSSASSSAPPNSQPQPQTKREKSVKEREQVKSA